MLTAILISVFFIIFPLFISINFIKNENSGAKLRIYLFNFIKLMDKRVKINNIDINFYKNKKIMLFRDCNLIKFYSNIELGLNDIDKTFYIINCINLLNNIIGNTIKNKKHYIKFNNNIAIDLNEEKFNFKVKIVFLINILAILISLLRKLFYGKK